METPMQNIGRVGRLGGALVWKFTYSSIAYLRVSGRYRHSVSQSPMHPLAKHHPFAYPADATGKSPEPTAVLGSRICRALAGVAILKGMRRYCGKWFAFFSRR